MRIRAGSSRDVPEIRLLQNACPESAQWPPDQNDFFVMEEDGEIVGFLVWRATAPDEIEVMNLAVHPAHRRRGFARALLAFLPRCSIFLEVRESNHAARSLYLSAGFQEAGFRGGYYQDPCEPAIVMRLQS